MSVTLYKAPPGKRRHPRGFYMNEFDRIRDWYEPTPYGEWALRYRGMIGRWLPTQRSKPAPPGYIGDTYFLRIKELPCP